MGDKDLVCRLKQLAAAGRTRHPGGPWGPIAEAGGYGHVGPFAKAGRPAAPGDISHKSTLG
ncbi:hypothetical protein GCM10017711_11520 [Paeniglutamicibacter sulfureus]